MKWRLRGVRPLRGEHWIDFKWLILFDLPHKFTNHLVFVKALAFV
jgi:hypothetical protein